MIISFEGIEGSGKTTQAKRLYKWLISQGYNCILTKEPGGTHIGNKIRNILLDKENKISDLTELFLYLADRAQHIEELIKPAQKNNNIIIIDRFIDSTLAYQGGGRGLPDELIKNMNKLFGNSITPDITILIDITPEEGFKRINRNNRLELESIEFYERIRNKYLEIAKINSSRVKVIDGRLSKSEIEKQIKKFILPKIRKEKNMIPKDTIRDVFIFQGLNEDELDIVAKICNETTFKKGDIVIYQGNTDKTLNIITKGILEIEIDLPGFREFIEIGKIAPKSIFGELTFIDGIPRSANIKCVEDAVIVSLDKEDFDSVAKNYPNIERIVMKNLAVLVSRRLRDTTTQLRDTISKLPSTIFGKKTKSIFKSIFEWISEMKGFSGGI